MSYLKLIYDKIQSLSEPIASALDVDITVVDHHSVRISGTGNFYHRINQSSPRNSLLSRVFESGVPEINIYDSENPKCGTCSDSATCKEINSMIYPIKINNHVIGVVCFASFTPEQDQRMVSKSTEYMEMIRYLAEDIEKEILSIQMVNELNIGLAEINGIINSINRGIVIINQEQRIIHINSKAIKSLNINFSVSKIINKKITDVISGLEINAADSGETLGSWSIGNKSVRVLYKVNYIFLDKETIATLVDFDVLEEIINIAMTYNDHNVVTFENIVGCSHVMQELISKARITAKSDSTIILRGASGTGKELFARSIHTSSFRKSGPFVAINCATLPENLIESELFGYEKGSFTGASPKGKIGKFEQANNGTLFLDEIADLPLHLQSKLLRVLQERKITRIGSTSQTSINVRIISATHKNLEEMIQKNEFREDLFYRLNVIPLCLPSLKDRDEDVILCAEYIIRTLCRKMSKFPKALSREVEEKFLKYPWPGNVRELENVLEYAINFSFDEEIGTKDLPEYFLNNYMNAEDRKRVGNTESVEINSLKSLDEMTRSFEGKMLRTLLEVHGDTTEGKKAIAKKLGMSVTTLYRKLNNYYQAQ